MHDGLNGSGGVLPLTLETTPGTTRPDQLDDHLRRLEAERDEAVADAAAITRLLAQVGAARTADEVVRAALDTVRAEFGWAYGSYWALDHQDRTLKYSVESGDAGPEFRDVTRRASFAEGVGLSGRAWRARDLCFTQDIGEMTDCVRREAAQRAGVRSGVCFPILVHGEVVGTMDFFATETLTPSAGRLDALRNVGRLVSQAIERMANREAADELARKVEQVLDVVEAAGGGDLTREMPVTGDDAMGRLAGGVAGLLATLRGHVADIATASDALAGASEELTALSQQLGAGAADTSERAASASSAAVEVSAGVQTVAAATEQMTASVHEIAKSAADAARVASGAVQVASEARRTVAELGDSSAEIGKVLKVITSIAQQTNILAINATIEAARAGDAGKGFAVVANEVKELAKETARATEDIGGKIEAIQADTAGAVTAIGEISEVITQISDFQSTIASAVEEQTATTNEISRAVGEAATGADDIAADVTRVATAASETQDGAQATLAAAVALSETARSLRGLVAQFRH